MGRSKKKQNIIERRKGVLAKPAAGAA